MRRATIAVAGVLTGVFALAGCGSSSGGETKAGVPLVQSGQLTVCSDVPYAPFEDFDKSSATGFKGFDIELASKIADQLGVKLAVKDVDFDPLQSGVTLNSGLCDMGASAMTISDKRKKHLDFSDPYYDSEQSLLVAKDSGIASIDDLAGKTVGVQKGTTGEAYAQEHVKGAKSIISYKDDGTEFQALKAGTVDALLQDLPVNLVHTADGQYTIAQKYQTGEQYGFAFKKGNALRDAVDKALASLKSDGTYKKIYDSYFQEK